jgi:hypothetical protein
VLLLSRSRIALFLLANALLANALLVSCANTPLGQSLQKSLEADPKLQSSPAVTPPPSVTPSLPVASSPSPSPTPSAGSSPAPAASSGAVQSAVDRVKPFSDRLSLGLAGDSLGIQTPTAPGPAPAVVAFTDLEKTPQPLRQYVSEVLQLGVLTLSPASIGGATKGNAPANAPEPKPDPPKPDPLKFEPNKIATRRDYARWLFAVNNYLQADTSVQQVRLGLETSQPAFQDVARTDPDFPVIQGLAEAGLIPSPLSGDSTTVIFRPNQPLTREHLLLWKVPMDTRQALPPATLEAVTQTWGFQDAARIDPKALRAVLADFQNGDLSNIRRVFGYTTLFQPKKPVTRAEAAAALWYFGFQGEGRSAQAALAKPN